MTQRNTLILNPSSFPTQTYKKLGYKIPTNKNINNKFNDNWGTFDTTSNEDQEYTPIVKQQLLNFVYNSIELYNYKYKLMEYEEDLSLLKEKKWYLSANYNGITGLLIFTKIKDKYYSVIIDRKTLAYNISKININDVKIIPITVRLDESIYNGTIIDGILLNNDTLSNGARIKNFLINDIFMFRGQDLVNEKINNKILNVNTYLSSIKNDDDVINSISLIPNKLFNISEIQQLVNVFIPKSVFSKAIKGIAFYPEISSTKLIYLFNNCGSEKTESQDIILSNKPQYQPQYQQNYQNNQYQQNSHYQKQPKIFTNQPKDNKMMSQDNLPNLHLQNIKFNDNSTLIFKIKKTDTVDVYMLYLGEKETQGTQKIFKYKKIGLASIPNRDCSTMCKEIFNKASSDSVLMKCKYNADKDKWIPLEQIIDRKRPDSIN